MGLFELKGRKREINTKNKKDMAKKSNWFDLLKKVFSPDPEEKKQRKEKEKPKKKWRFGRSKSTDQLASSSVEEIPLDRQTQNHTDIPSTSHTIPTTIPARLEEIKEVKLSELEGDPNKHAYSVALASAVAAEAAAVAAQAAAEVVRLTAVGSTNHLQATQKAAERSKEEIAAVRIQTAVRGFLARRSLRALKGLARLKTLVDGNTVKRQTEKALHFVQSQTRIQSAIRSRRRQMVEEKQAIQKLAKLKQKEQDKLKMGEDWDFSLQTKEQIESSIQTRQEAAIRRERALAYAFSHQWRNSTSSSNRVSNAFITDPTNPQWGWSWLDRWISARPWEPQNPKPSPSQLTDHSSLKSAVQSLKPDPNPNFHSHSAPAKTSRPASPSTPRSKISSIKPPKARSSSPKPTIRVSKEEDSRSIGSVKSERMRRHSVAGSIGDNVSLTSLTSLPVVPSYLQSTESSRLKSRTVYSPISEKIDERGVKKRLSFAGGEKLTGLGLRSASPVKGRRFSGPAKVELVSLKDEE
ncbi:hypothetical protein LUZ60_011092 [Juncus effusus]|nr:hypothetical protein LUZ60_011092 [Juncus effusus]